MFPTLVNPILRFMPIDIDSRALGIGWLVAVGEVMIAAGLVFNKTRRAAVAAVVLLHISIIVVLSIGGVHDNFVVLPWNVAMVSIVIYLFGRDVVQNSPGEIVYPVIELSSGRGIAMSRAIQILVFVMPLLHFVGLWDSYLSMSVYSGRLTVSYLSINEMGQGSTSSETGSIKHFEVGNKRLPIARWSFRELRVPDYPELRAHWTLTKVLCRQLPVGKTLTLMTIERDNIFKEFRRSQRSCDGSLNESCDASPGTQSEACLKQMAIFASFNRALSYAKSDEATD